jgi:uncharacterized membrane protein YfcA
MPMVPIVPGVEINVLIVVFLGLAIGVISGFVGVGGGFIMTPALIILGVPAHYAVGISMLWVMGNSLMGAIRHHQEGNVDFKLAFIAAIFVIGGIEVGVRLLNFAQSRNVAEEAVLYISIVVLFLVGAYMFWALRRTNSESNTGSNPESQTGLSRQISSIRIPPVILFSKSGVSVSLVFVAAIGIVTGILSGFLGVGGGFLIVPSLIYLLGVPSYTAVGTCLLLFIFSSAYGSFRHIISGNVLIYVSLLMLVGSSIGVQVGALATRYIKGISMRFVLANTIFVAALGSALKLLSLLINNPGDWLQATTHIVTFGGLGVIIVMIMALLIRGIRQRQAVYQVSPVDPLLKK